MATEFFRKEYGETPSGYVVVVGKRGGLADGVYAEVSYEVRQGVRTVGSFPTDKAAHASASALVGN